MEVAEHIAALRLEGDLLAKAVAGADPDAPIPTCPDWRMRDLVLHIGEVHRWAALHVAGASREALSFTATAPADPDLVEWFREGHADLIKVLEAAPPNLDCWTFLPAPSALAFWARRQNHETGIHRVDAESPGASVTPFPPEVAVDGIDEMLFGFASRPSGKLRADPPRTLHLHATDIEGEWSILIGPERVEVRQEHGKAHCSVRAAASDLHLLLWNRRTPDRLEVHGDSGILSLWREKVRIRWV